MTSDYGRRRHPHESSSSSGPTAPIPPTPGSILKGTVARIEPYGAFIQLHPRENRLRGLCHISQLSSYKVDSVNDVLSIEDDVFVKVLDCEQEEPPMSSSDDPRGRNRFPRYKIRLSVKYASQDGEYTDLDPTGQEADRESRSRRNREEFGQRGGGGDERGGGRGGVPPSQLEQNLNSQIGMGIAIDPLAAMQQGTNSSGGGSGLVLRNQGNHAGKIIINGYSLVNDDEGEPERKPEPEPTAESSRSIERPVVSSRPIVKGVGRGRGATLPAWMTQTSSSDGPTGHNGSVSVHSRSRSRSRSSSRGSTSPTRRKKKRKKEERSSSSKKHSKHSKHKRERHESKRRKRHRSERKKRRQYDHDDSDCYSRSGAGGGKEDDSYSRSRSRSRSREHKRKSQSRHRNKSTSTRNGSSTRSRKDSTTR